MTSTPPWLRLCLTCGHAEGAHHSSGPTSLLRTPSRGFCREPGCECRRWVDDRCPECGGSRGVLAGVPTCWECSDGDASGEGRAA